MQAPIMEWNTAKKTWQHSTDNHLFALWAPWLDPWPTSGMTVNGRVYELPTLERHTTDSESLSSPILRTPTASQGEGGALGEEEAKRRGNTVGIRDQAMDIAALNGEKVSRNEINLMPTLVAQEGAKAPAQQTSAVKSKTGQVWLSNVAKDLEPKLPTPQVDDSKNTGHNQGRRTTLASEVWAANKTDWGKFQPAIRRW